MPINRRNQVSRGVGRVHVISVPSRRSHSALPAEGRPGPSVVYDDDHSDDDDDNVINNQAGTIAWLLLKHAFQPGVSH